MEKNCAPELDFCAIDFETGCSAKASACSVGLVRVRGGEPSDTFHSFIRPPEGMEIQPFFTGIHGISQEDVRGAPSFCQLWPRMREFIGADFLVAHNASFDRSVLCAAMEHYGIGGQAPRFECTVVRSRRAWPRLPDHRLDTVARHLGVELRHHEALSDALACARIWVAAELRG